MNSPTPNNGVNDNAPKDTINLANQSKKPHKKLLIISIIVIFLIIIAAIIIALILNNSNSGDTEEELEEDPVVMNKNCDALTTFDEINTCINDKFKEDGSLDNIRENYKTAIAASLARDDQETAISLIDSESTFLADRNRCGMVQEMLNSTDTSSFSQSSLHEFYSNAAEISTFCEDSASYEHWNALYQQNIITTEGS